MKLTVDHSPEFKQQLLELMDAVEEELDELDKVEIIPSGREIFRVSLDGKVIMDLDEENFSAEKVTETIKEEN